MTADLDLNRLYRQHAADLNGYLRQRLNCPELAEDLCQEAFLRLSQRPPNDDLKEPRAYLFRIAQNLIIDYHRRHSRIDFQPLEDPRLCLACPHSCPETATERSLCRRHLRHALAALPPRLRQALTWHRLEGLTQLEIGRRLGVSERMAGRYIAQALGRCRATLLAESVPARTSCL